MRVVQLTLEEKLVAALDGAAKRLGTTRSGFARDAVRVPQIRTAVFFPPGT